MENLAVLGAFAPVAMVAVVLSVGGWIFTTWLRVRNGYPLEGSWGQQVHPSTNKDDQERIKLIGSENAQLRAEMGSVKDRLAVLERIATDSGSRLSRTIDDLRDPSVN
jgi:hypothetical protein